jgi:hypothetical protein
MVIAASLLALTLPRPWLNSRGFRFHLLWMIGGVVGVFVLFLLLGLGIILIGMWRKSSSHGPASTPPRYSDRERVLIQQEFDRRRGTYRSHGLLAVIKFQGAQPSDFGQIRRKLAPFVRGSAPINVDMGPLPDGLNITAYPVTDLKALLDSAALGEVKELDPVALTATVIFTSPIPSPAIPRETRPMPAAPSR